MTEDWKMVVKKRKSRSTRDRVRLLVEVFDVPLRQAKNIVFPRNFSQTRIMNEITEEEFDVAYSLRETPEILVQFLMALNQNLPAYKPRRMTEQEKEEKNKEHLRRMREDADYHATHLANNEFQTFKRKLAREERERYGN
jgi:hypothetical protein